MASKYLEIVFIWSVICTMSWPVHTKSILSSEQIIDLAANTTTSDSQPNHQINTRQTSTMSNWFGGLFGTTSSSPFIRCSCCKHKMLFVLLNIYLNSVCSFVTHNPFNPLHHCSIQAWSKNIFGTKKYLWKFPIYFQHAEM